MATINRSLDRSALLARRSLYGALLVAAVWAVFAFGFSTWDSILPGDGGFSGGERYPVSPTVSIVPAEGWRREPSKSSLGDLLVASKGLSGIEVSIGSASVASSETRLRKTFENDGKTEYRLSDSQTFTTDAGVKGRTFLAQSTDKIARCWIVARNAQTVEITGSARTTDDASVQAELEDMALSIRITAAT